MRDVRIVRAAAAAVLAVLGALVAPAAAAQAAQPQVTMTGSSFAGVAVQQWQGTFNETEEGNIDVTVSSSIIGLNNFCQRTAEVAISELSYGSDQSSCTSSEVPEAYQYIPVAAGGLAFEYNLVNGHGKRITDLVLDGKVLARIFTGAINWWNAAAIRALNPRVDLPHERIVPFYRSDPSGENELLSAYLLHVDPAVATSFEQLAGVPDPGQPDAVWAEFPDGVPTSSQFPNAAKLVPTNGADVAAQGPVHKVGGISYVADAYAESAGLPVASVRNASGQPVQPMATAVSAALQGVTASGADVADLSAAFSNSDPAAYPLSMLSYLVTPCAASAGSSGGPTCAGTGPTTLTPAQGAELGSFVEYADCAGQASVAALGYAPLSASLVDAAFAEVGDIPGATAPAPPTAATCPNPTLGTPG